MKHELTLTLKPYLYSKTARDQFRMTKDYVLDILKPYKHTTVCELTSTNNVHYHSLIDIEGIIARDILLNRIRPYKPLGKPHLQQVQYEESYEKYLMKSIKDSTTILGEYAVIKDDWQLLKNSETFIKKFENTSGSVAPAARRDSQTFYKNVLEFPPLNEDEACEVRTLPRPRRVRLVVPTDPSIYEWYNETI